MSDFERASEILLELDALPAAEREAALAARYADEPAAVLERVRFLLAGEARAWTGLDRPVVDLQREPVPRPERVGAYEIVGLLGEGGMGVVYEARQESPRRSVALKLLRFGLASEDARRRFRIESEVLGWLQHPGIAQIHEAGTARVDGVDLPFMAMELVHGERIDAWARRHDPALRERLELVARLCDAVHHAHQKGVVHRDLKPANVLVTAAGEPKVLDFGIARLAREEGRPDTLLTRTGDVIGTLPYMSPEQVAGDPSQIDTRTDVYALGALAYEVLAGQRPLDVERRSLPEAARAIAEDEPTTLGLLDRGLRGDVETIVAKALSKEKERRYASAEELARDIRRHLRDEPIEARPASRTYKLRKFARRNRLLVASGAALVLVLIAGIVTSTTLLLEARAQARRAEEEARDVFSLSAADRLEELLAEVDDLWPARADRLDDLRAWEARATALVAQLPEHRARRDELEGRALPWTEADRSRDRAEHPRAGELEPLRERLARLEESLLAMSPAEADAVYVAGGETQGEKVARQIDEGIAELEQLERALAGRWRFRFASEEESWWHGRLRELIAGLEAFADPERGELAGLSPTHGWGVRRRIAFVEGLEERTRTGAEARARWDEAIAQAADAERFPAYAGLELTPQLGLLPLGPDPQSGLLEFAHVATGEVPERGPDDRLVMTEQTGLVFVLIPGGTLSMGAQASNPKLPAYDPLARPDEAPVHEVELAPYFLSRYEMSQGQWLRIAGTNPSAHGPDAVPVGGKAFTLLHPVEQVSFDDCATLLSGFGLLVPTEAQWEWAARGGTTTRWWSGEARDSMRGACNLADRAALRAGATWKAAEDWPDLDDGWPMHAPVDALRPSPFGLHGTMGNVREWTRCFAGSYALAHRPGDGYRDEFGSDPQLRITRGGSFGNVAAVARVTHRELVARDVAGNYIGVRPARALDD